MKKLIFAVLACVLPFFLSSCKKSQSEPVYEATATIKTATDQTCYFQIDDETALVATNEAFKKNPFNKETRVHLFYIDRGEIDKPGWSTTPNWRSGEILSLEDILTKKPVEPGEYGTGKIEILKSPFNSIEDGYMTLCFEIVVGDGRVHTINLVKTEDPNKFLLRHDDAGDGQSVRLQGAIAFDLHEMPFPNSQEFDVLLEYEGYAARKTLKFHYKDGKFSAPSRADVGGYLIPE